MYKILSKIQEDRLKNHKTYQKEKSEMVRNEFIKVMYNRKLVMQ